MRVYHDWEFLETDNSIYPISVGMVAENGSELYYEFAQAPWTLIHNHAWLRHNVIPALSPGFNTAIVTGECNSIVRSTMSIRIRVHDFLEEVYYQSNGPIELWGWYSSYDHVCLSQLFGAMVNLPSFVPMWTNDLKQEVMRLGNPTIPNMREPEEVAHNALDDARSEKRMGEWLQGYAQGGRLRKREPLRRPTYLDPIFMED